MFKEIISNGDTTHYALWGLVIFVAVFVCITVWALTRSKKEIHDWSSMPLDDQPDDPVRTPRKKADPTDPHGPTHSHQAQA